MPRKPAMPKIAITQLRKAAIVRMKESASSSANGLTSWTAWPGREVLCAEWNGFGNNGKTREIGNSGLDAEATATGLVKTA